MPKKMVRRKFLYIVIEQDHRFIKSRIRPILGSKSYTFASATMDGSEVKKMIRKDPLGGGLCPFKRFAMLAA
ncbi:hypothetical protein [Ruegeria sp. SCP11]|uniref:hypothetical protein n=1 Tax=Ruegeria sp. SCP11 TaxID=3141378 RepID=UPI00333BD4E7